MQKKLEEIYKIRLQKLEKLKKAGIDPYPARTKRSHTLEEVIKDFNKLQDKTLTLCGRLRLIRKHGKATFCHIEDGSSSFQIYLRQDILGKDKYKFFENFDIGDFIEVKGLLFKTKTGEKTLKVKEFRMLAKALLPLPEKWKGLKDQELRYRKRYLDLLMNKEVKKRFIIRSKIIDAMREFLINKGFLEVTTPIMQPVYGGTLARPFVTHSTALKQDLYLRVSNELYLKRLIVAGFEKVFEFSVDFRNEGIDTRHNPEFLQMETMAAYSDYKENMKMTEGMISYIAKKVLGTEKITYQGSKINLALPWKRLALISAIKKFAKIDFSKVKNVAQAKKLASRCGADIKRRLSLGKIIEQVLDDVVRPKLIQPTFIYDYPCDTSPLAKPKSDDPDFTERFEIFIAGEELGNVYSELNDPEILRKNFKEQVELRKKGDIEAHPQDLDFIEALSYGMPPTSGIGIGIERLVMLLTDTPSIREVILFPTLKEKK